VSKKLEDHLQKFTDEVATNLAKDLDRCILQMILEGKTFRKGWRVAVSIHSGTTHVGYEIAQVPPWLTNEELQRTTGKESCRFYGERP
jgi:hypothetical protein